MNWQAGILNLNISFPPKDGLFHCVIGNESCDLDSFVSSLIIALKEDKVHLINMKYETFVKKPDILKVCKVFDIPIQKLLFYNKDTKKIENSENKTFDISTFQIDATLTDHNKSNIENVKVKEVYDHHIVTDSSDLLTCEKIHIDLTLYSCCSVIYTLNKYDYLRGIRNLSNKEMEKYRSVLFRKTCISPETPFNHGMLLLLFITISVDSYNIMLYTKDNSTCPNYSLTTEIRRSLRLKETCTKTIFDNYSPKPLEHFTIQTLITDYKSDTIKGERIDSATVILKKLPKKSDLLEIKEFFIGEKGADKFFVMFVIKNNSRFLFTNNLEVPRSEVIDSYDELKKVNISFSRKKYYLFLNSQ